MIYRVSTIPVEVNSGLAAARLPLHVGKLPVESMEDLSWSFWCEMATHWLLFSFFLVSKNWTLNFWGTINRSIMYMLLGDPARPIPIWRKGRYITNHPHGSNFCYGKDVAQDQMFGTTKDHHLPFVQLSVTCFFSAGFAPARCSEKLLETSSTRKKHTVHGQLSDRSEELIQENGEKLEKKTKGKIQSTLVKVSSFGNQNSYSWVKILNLPFGSATSL